VFNDNEKTIQPSNLCYNNSYKICPLKHSENVFLFLLGKKTTLDLRLQIFVVIYLSMHFLMYTNIVLSQFLFLMESTLKTFTVFYVSPSHLMFKTCL